MTAPAKEIRGHSELLPMWRVPVAVGFRVLPLLPNSKKAAQKWKEFRDRSPGPDEISDWKCRAYNVGIITGIPSGVVVVDFDTLEALERAHQLGLPFTVMAKTPRGEHHYFRHPGGAIPNAVSIFDGADLRGDGGYVVGPGSNYQPTPEELKSGKRAGKYTWVNSPEDTELADCPSWLLQLIRERSHDSETRDLTIRQGKLNPEGCTLQSLIGAVASAPAGSRNDELNKCAFLAGKGVQLGRFTSEEALVALRAAAVSAGLELSEIDSTLMSGFKSGQQKALIDQTEDAVAEVFALENRDQFLFDHDRGCWFRWAGSHWEIDRKHLSLETLRLIARRLAGEGKSLRRAAGVRGAETLSRSDPRIAVTSAEWDNDALLLATPGGTVDLRSGTLRAASPSDRLTKVASVTPCSGKPERWLRFLRESTGADEDFIQFLQKMCGYLLTGETREQSLFFIYGSGRNGKSVFLNVIQGILKDYAVVAPMDAFTVSKFERHPTEIAMMCGARVVTACETDQENTWDEAKVKQLTGGDRVSARFMRQDFFSFEPTFKLVIVGNHRPRLQSVEESTRRRFKMIPFLRSPAVPDPALAKKLEAEFPQILAWMIAGCLLWQRNGLGTAKAIDTATESYFEEQDVISEWAREACKTGPQERAQPKELFDSWTDYCHSRGLRPGSLLTFGDALEKHGYGRRRSNGVRYHLGICPNAFTDLSAGSDGS